MTLIVDRLINIMKWPVAASMLFLLPFLWTEIPPLLLKTVTSTFLPFWGGVFGYVILWKVWFRRFGSFLPTLEHELTHAIFAILTGHRVVGFAVRWNRGGHIRYIGGEGNWWITIAPYVFPLFLIISLPVLAIYITDDLVRGVSLGVIFGFELISTWREIHRNQPDLKEVGWIFCFVFLPPALLTVYGSVLYFLSSDLSSLFLWHQEGLYSIWAVLQEVWNGRNLH